MKICNVVMNSIWYDPRVRKQIISYIGAGVDIECVGLKDAKYNERAVNEIPCKVYLAEVAKSPATKKRSLAKIFKTFFILRKEIRQVRDLIIDVNPDIIHANDLNALVPAYLAAQKLGCKVIYDTHEIFLDEYYFHNHRLPRLFYGYYEKKIISRVDAVICVSHAAAEYFATKYRITPPTVVTNCCISSETVVGEHKNPGFEVLIHGFFHVGRGYDILVEASAFLHNYPEIKLAIRGEGSSSLPKEDLQSMAEKLSASNVVFYPKVKVEELMPLASRSMVGVAITEKLCLNFKLSVSNKLFEYAAAGLPVIMSDIPEHRYLNDKYGFGVIIKNDTPEDLANAIIKLYTDKDFYRTCQQNAVRLSSEITWENEFKKLLVIEENLLKN